MLNFDCIIIGSGIAGMTAAHYLKRGNLNVVVLERELPGGKLNNIEVVENYPGFLKIEGITLAGYIYEQIIKAGVIYKYGNVLNIKQEKGLNIITTDTEVISSKYVIIASGRVPKKLGLDLEEKLIGKGLSFCTLCDGNFFKNKDVAVVGGGNSAIESSIYLAGLCQNVYLIHQLATFQAEAILVERLKELANVKIKYNSEVVQYLSKGEKLEGIVIKTNDETINLGVSGLFLNIGYVPDTEYLKSLGLKLDHDYVLVDSNMKTNLDNIYACGDVIKKDVYQLTTATGEATIAANSILNKSC